MGWREPEPQDIGRVVFDRGFRKTEGNLIKAKETLRNSYLSRREANVEPANIYFDEAMKDKPDAAWEALLKEVSLEGRQQENMARRAHGEFNR